MDRDGTIMYDCGYLSDPDGVELIPGVRESLQACAEEEWGLFLHTNQSGVNRGMFTLEDVERVNQRMMGMLGLPMRRFDGVCIAVELPEADPIYRKPYPRFVHEMVDFYEIPPERCWMVGDRWSDAQTGLNAGVQSILVETGKPITTETRKLAYHFQVPIMPTLVEAIEFIREWCHLPVTSAPESPAKGAPDRSARPKGSLLRGGSGASSRLFPPP